MTNPKQTNEDNMSIRDLALRVNQLEAIRSPSKSGWLPLILASGLLIILTANIFLLWSQMSSQTARSREIAFWELCHSGLTPDQRADRFMQLTAAGNTEWQSAILDSLKLDKADLSRMKIESARFTKCSFREASFVNAVMNNSGLDLTDYSKANFSSAQLRNTTFFKSTLVEADFRNAILLSASLEQAKAQKAKFVAAKMGDAFLAMTDLTDADLTGADLSGAHLEAAILKGTDLALANLYGAFLEDADFTDSNWWRSRGLDSLQLEDFAIRFPPTPNASDSRHRDFEIWLTKRDERSEN